MPFVSEAPVTPYGMQQRVLVFAQLRPEAFRHGRTSRKRMAATPARHVLPYERFGARAMGLAEEPRPRQGSDRGDKRRAAPARHVYADAFQAHLEKTCGVKATYSNYEQCAAYRTWLN